MVNIPFNKMHGLGNDFVVINNIDQRIDLKLLPLNLIADRHLGIGCDQILIIEPSKKADFFCRIFNSDGSEAKQCGNGLRCVARYIYDEKWHQESSFHIETLAGIFKASIENNHVRIQMGTPNLQKNDVSLMIDQTQLGPFSLINLGNPHLILKVNSLKESQKLFDECAKKLSTHAQFPDQINVGFMEIVNRKQIRLRTFERGSGETLACGSNACAAVAAGILNGWLDQTASVELRFGVLQVNWPGENKPIELIGPAENVFSGIWGK